MGTFMRIGPYRVEIRTREHGIPHFHVVGPDGEASLDISGFRVLASMGMDERDLRAICKILIVHRQKIQEIWNENQETQI